MCGVKYYGKHVMTYDIIDITRNAMGKVWSQLDDIYSG